MSSFWDGFVTGAADQLKTEIDESQERVQKRADRIAEFQMTQFQEARKLNRRKREEVKEMTKAIAATLGGDKQALVAAASIVSQGDLYAKEAYKVLLESKLAGDDPRKFIGEIPDMGLEGKDITVEDIAKSMYPETKFDFTVPKESSGSIFDKVFGGSVEGRVEERIKEGRSMGILPEESDGKQAAPSAFPSVPSVPVDFAGIYKARKARTKSGEGSGGKITFGQAQTYVNSEVKRALGNDGYEVTSTGTLTKRGSDGISSIIPENSQEYQIYLTKKAEYEDEYRKRVASFLPPSLVPLFIPPAQAPKPAQAPDNPEEPWTNDPEN